MRERLLSYLLDELDPADASRLEAEIEQDDSLKAELEQLRACLAEDEPIAGDEPPTGLADRTADSVYDLVVGLSSDNLLASNAERSADHAPVVDLPPEPQPSGGRFGFTFVDGFVAAGVVMALGMMLLPALRESREASRRLACQNNLRQIGQALQQYAEGHGGLLPHVQPGENAGVYSLRVVGGKLIDRETMARLLVCPSSPLHQEIDDTGEPIHLPSDEELRQQNNAAVLAHWRRRMGGSYAYRLGYFEGPMYCPISNRLSSRAPMLSDAPDPSVGRWQSVNHGGCGQNVLYQDGGVRHRANCFLKCADDNMFLNSAGSPAAGLRWDDVVLVRSEVTPGVMADPAAMKGRPQKLRVLLRFRRKQSPTSPPVEKPIVNAVSN